MSKQRCGVATRVVDAIVPCLSWPLGQDQQFVDIASDNAVFMAVTPSGTLRRWTVNGDGCACAALCAVASSRLLLCVSLSNGRTAGTMHTYSNKAPSGRRFLRVSLLITENNLQVVCGLLDNNGQPAHRSALLSRSRCADPFCLDLFCADLHCFGIDAGNPGLTSAVYFPALSTLLTLPSGRWVLAANALATISRGAHSGLGACSSSRACAMDAMKGRFCWNPLLSAYPSFFREAFSRLFACPVWMACTLPALPVHQVHVLNRCGALLLDAAGSSDG